MIRVRPERGEGRRSSASGGFREPLAPALLVIGLGSGPLGRGTAAGELGIVPLQVPLTFLQAGHFRLPHGIGRGSLRLEPGHPVLEVPDLLGVFRELGAGIPASPALCTGAAEEGELI